MLLPIELVNYIISFAPIEPPHFKCMNHVICAYHQDHNWYAFDRGARFYHIKYLLSFSEYYFDTLINNEDYKFGQDCYNDLTNIVPPATREYEENRQD
jgi:hypothetical protein